MLDFLKKLLEPPAPERAAIAPGVALAALMVEAARSDGDYAQSERETIDAVLSALLHLSPAAAAALRAEAEAAQEEAADMVRFTRVLKQAYQPQERAELIGALWRVALADGDRAAEEDALIRRLCPLLGVSDAESGMMRQRAAAIAEGGAS